LVLEAAAEDAVARCLVEEGAHDLAQTVAVVVEKLGLERTALPLALSGGVLLGSPFCRERGQLAMERDGLRGQPATLVQEPAEGALRRGLVRWVDFQSTKANSLASNKAWA